jgi:hypothetical protein
MICEGRLAELNGHTNQASVIYLDAMRFGNQALRGGVVIDRLIGIGLENMGRSKLQRLIKSLASADCRAAIVAQNEIEAHQESYDDVIQQEAAWRDRAFPRYQRIMVTIQWMIKEKSFDPLKSTSSKIKEKINDNDLERRQLMVNLAAHAFLLDKGRRPKGVAELVPDYLKTEPHDPDNGMVLSIFPWDAY